MSVDEKEVRKIVEQAVYRALGQTPAAATGATEAPKAVKADKPAAAPDPMTRVQLAPAASPAAAVAPTKPVAAPPLPAARGPVGALITQEHLRGVARGTVFRLPAGALITPSARETALLRNITLLPTSEMLAAPVPAAASGTPTPAVGGAGDPARIVALAADHGGFELKEQLKPYLAELGYAIRDCGTSSAQPVDYPDYAYAAARLVADGQAARGIVVDGAGIGSCMTANKVPGVRAALCHDDTTARNAREHNDANVLTLGGKLLGIQVARDVVKRFLQTPFGGERHARRVQKIAEVEARFAKRS